MPFPVHWADSAHAIALLCLKLLPLEKIQTQLFSECPSFPNYHPVPGSGDPLVPAAVAASRAVVPVTLAAAVVVVLPLGRLNRQFFLFFTIPSIYRLVHRSPLARPAKLPLELVAVPMAGSVA